MHASTSSSSFDLVVPAAGGEKELNKAWWFLFGSIGRDGSREDRDQADRERDEPAGHLFQAPGRAA